MIQSLVSPHPSEELLSRLADQSDTEAMRTRAGRHVARCATCRAAIDELRALGDAARAMSDEPLPSTLWPRIAAGEAVSDRHPAETSRARRAPAFRRRALLGAAAAAIMVALAWPVLRHRDLGAAAAQRVTLLPRYPRPGDVVTISYSPASNASLSDTLWLEGTVVVRTATGSSEQLPLGVPLPRGGEGYRGTLRMPTSALAAVLHVVDERWPRVDQRRLDDALILTAGSESSRPSLDALESAVSAPYFDAQRDLLAAEFARWAPGHPMRWLLERGHATEGVFDWLGYFTSLEHRFARLTRTMNARPNARAGELAGMAALAYRIEEPAAAGEWVDRLVREHPESPWALAMRVEQMHAMELRDAPRDSVAALLPSLDSLYARSPRALGDLWTLGAVVARNADSLTVRRWLLRTMRAGQHVPPDLFGRGTIFADAELRDSLEANARERLARTVSAGGPAARQTRAMAYATLASVALARGEYRRAIGLTDSTHLGTCYWIGQDTRAAAYLALGDTASAEPLLYIHAIAQTRASAHVREMLGARVDSPRFRQAADSALRAYRACTKRGR